jgi:hypothetical protein
MSTPDFLRAGEAQADAYQAKAEDDDERWQAKLAELGALSVDDFVKRLHDYSDWLRVTHTIENQAQHELREGDCE